jgi:molybdate transport system ATP-binding protein
MNAALEVRARLDFRELGRAAFSLDVELEFPSCVTAILGPTGSGKSTLLGVVAGRFPGARGRVALGDRVLADHSRRVFLSPARRRVGFAFQDYLLFPHLSVLDNVTFGIHHALHRRRRALEWLERLGAADLAPRHPTTLSGGEQQRVALARALASGPDLVLLDEPTAALDLGTRAEILDALRAAQREAAVPFLHVCHSPSEATRVGDRAVVMAGGRVVQQGTPLEVLSTPRSLAVAEVGGFENVLAARVLEHREEQGVTLVEADGVKLEMGYHRLPPGAELDVALRAEDIIVALEPLRTSARNVLRATVRRVHREQARVELEVAAPAPLRVKVTPITVDEMNLREGTTVYLLIKARALHPLE